MQVTTKQILEFLYGKLRNATTSESCLEFIEEKLNENFSEERRKQVIQKIKNLHMRLILVLNKLSVTNRNLGRALGHFPNSNGYFLSDDNENTQSCNIEYDESETSSNFMDISSSSAMPPSPSLTMAPSPSSSTSSPNIKGRPRMINRAQMSERSKRRAVDSLADGMDEESSTLLVKKIAKTISNEGLESVLKTVNQRLKPEIVDNTVPKKVSHLDALALIINNNLTVIAYEEIRELTKKYGANIFPCYKTLQSFKKTIEPDNITVTDTKASVPLKDLTHNTSERLIESIKSGIIETLTYHNLDQNEELEATLICSWGMDGTTGQSQYHQADSDGNAVKDTALFAASMAALKLTINCANGSEIVLWENPAPGSAQSNRCIQIEHAKETDAYTTEVYENIQQQIDELGSHGVYLSSTTRLNVNFDFHLTLIDGKVAKVLSETPSCARCPCCLAVPTEMNNLENFSNGHFDIKNNFPHTIGPLHAVMNVTNLLYNIACKKGINKWRVSNPREKEMVEENKKCIKQQIFQAFSVRFDEPRAGGSGTSSTGSVCRKMLQDPKKLAQALEIDEELVTRLSVVLKVLNLKESIDTAKFRVYCRETYELYTELYPWYYMNATLHKVLAHGAEIIESLPLSLGMFTEEGAESRNKYYRKFREAHARKTSRAANMKDVFVRTLLSSDPIISKTSVEKGLRKTKEKELSMELLEFVKQPIEHNDEEDQSEDNFHEVDILEFLYNYDNETLISDNED